MELESVYGTYADLALPKPPIVAEAFAALMEVRQVHLLMTQPGFRPTEIIVVTTLSDPKRYPKAKLVVL